MKTAAIQLAISDSCDTKSARIKYALAMADRCAGADLILLPELWNVGFFNYDKYHDFSEPIDGETASALSAKAKELGAYIFGGSFVERRGGAYFNTSLLFDRGGRRIAQYSKIHLFTYRSREPELLSPGDAITVADTEFGRVGLAACYDLRFPELFRRMAVEYGAEMFLVTAGWPFPRMEAWNVLCRARAIENMCWLVSCNAAGTSRGARFGGHSQVVDPWGTVIAGSGFEEAIVRAEFAESHVHRFRKEFPALSDIRLI